MAENIINIYIKNKIVLKVFERYMILYNIADKGNK